MYRANLATACRIYAPDFTDCLQIRSRVSLSGGGGGGRPYLLHIVGPLRTWSGLRRPGRTPSGRRRVHLRIRDWYRPRSDTRYGIRRIHQPPLPLSDYRGLTSFSILYIACIRQYRAHMLTARPLCFRIGLGSCVMLCQFSY